MTQASSFGSLAKRLTARAAELAEAHGETLALARQGDPRRWRDARLLWPNFTKG